MAHNSLHAILANGALRHPNTVALRSAQGTLTYRGLKARADEFAVHLADAGVRPGDRVGLCLDKTPDSVALLFAIMELGAAYVPVDPTAPVERIGWIFSDCSVRVIVAQTQIADRLVQAMDCSAHKVAAAGTLGDLAILASPAPTQTAPEGLAYILFTSGSTGRPKGVMHTHSSALAFVDWCLGEFEPQSADRFSSHAPFHFDLSILDLYVPLSCGASVRLINADERRRPQAIAQLIQDDRLTFWYSTPTILRALVEFTDLAGFDHSALQTVCFAGEVFPVKHLKSLAQIWKRMRYYNLYGPTETNVCTFHRLGDPAAMADDDDIPIGTACSGDELRVVDDDGAPVGKGEFGELLVAGPSVATGYWNAPEKTAAVFTELDDGPWYRTGDVVVEREDGALLYHGRRDRMVKRRGYRVELGEIEAAMVRHECISECAAVAVEPTPGDVQIIAFLSWNGAGNPSLITLKKFANGVLPVYMIPDRFLQLDALPNTSTDKVDIQKLKELSLGLYR